MTVINVMVQGGPHASFDRITRNGLDSRNGGLLRLSLLENLLEGRISGRLGSGHTGPLVNILMLFFLAFSDWPVLRQLNALPPLAPTPVLIDTAKQK